MSTKKTLVIALTLIILISIRFISSQGETSYCCEKTTYGAWCQNEPVEKCDTGFRKAPTSCEATAYCKKGTCYNSIDGVCLPNVPEKVCQDSDGIWKDTKPEDIPQCQLGCCLIGEQAAFVTQTKCKSLAGLYGLEISYRTDIQNEVECIMSASPDVKGACVIDNGLERTCKFLAKKECQALQTNNEGAGGFFGFGNNESETEIEFHEGYLCTSETLTTNCAPTEKTTCVEGKDEVYFVDSCGNLANIYDAVKINDPAYWDKIVGYDKTCTLSYNQNGQPTNSRVCGNCDYYSGSTCKSAGRSDNPEYGNNICKYLGCEYDTDGNGKIDNDEKYNHGETWCADSKGTSQIVVNSLEDHTPLSKTYEKTSENIPGSRYFRMVCYNNEVSIEPCADFRQEICMQSEVNGFSTAACKVNMWQDCVAQDNEDDCTNIDKRDCKWIKKVTNVKILGISGQIESEISEKCVPNYAPGFDFWQEGDAQGICALANAQCQVKYEKKLGGSWECVDNCECLKGGVDWEGNKIEFCQSLGDCGFKTNYLGDDGYNTQFDGFAGKSWTE